MSGTTKARKDPKRVERMRQTAELLDLGVRDAAAIGQRLGVHERTVHRYLRELNGGASRRVTIFPSVKPQVLEHFRKYPHLRISAYMLGRVLGWSADSYVPVLNALRSLEQDGLVRSEVGVRDDRDFTQKLKVILWSLTEEGKRDER